MIYTKSRRNSQSKQNRNNRQYDYLNQSINSNIPTHYLNRQRNSIATVTPIPKNRNQFAQNFSGKKTDKKYDYSVNLQNSFDKDIANYPLNKTTFNNNQKLTNWIKNDYQYKNRNSILKQCHRSSQRYDKRYSITKLPSQKIDISKFVQINDSYNNSVQKLSSKKSMNKQNTNNYKNSQQKQIFGKNILDDKFYFTQKLKQFSTNSRALNQLNNNKIQNSISKAKYQYRYNKMRNKPYQMIDQPRNSKKFFDNQQSKIQRQRQLDQKFKRKAKNYEQQIKNRQSYRQKQSMPKNQFLQKSQQQNSKIKQKITRISQLNHQINTKLQNMLMKRNLL